LLHDLPFYEHNTPLLLPDGSPYRDEVGQPLFAFHDQIVFWASLTPVGQGALVAAAPRFPVVIDTGFNDTLLISEAQLRHWARLDPANLTLSAVFLQISGGHLLLRYEVDLFVHPNLPGERDQFAATQAERLELPDGLAVWPMHVPGGRRLPLLGVRALAVAGLRLSINGARRLVSIDSQGP
jgi:hypothetical protein